MLRNWLMGTARQKLREATAQSAQRTSAHADPKTAAEQGPPKPPRDVCHVGLVFALSIEAGGMLDRLKGVIMTEGAGFVAREGGLAGKRLVVIESGVGRTAAKRATQAIILGHSPRWIISAGFAGGLHESIAQGDILLANAIVDTDGKQFEIDFKLDPATIASHGHLHVGRLLTSERIIAEPSEKKNLGQRYGALAVDMESIAVADVCRQEKIRFLAVRAISDAVHHAMPRDIDYLVKRTSTASRLGAAAGAILRRPSSIKDMWQLREDALVASERLATFLVGIIEQLPK